MKHIWILVLLLMTPGARADLPDEPEYDRDGRPWFSKYFDEGRVKEITGLKFPKGWENSREIEWQDLSVREKLPADYDLRKLHPKGALQPIRRQRCGDCWAHSVIATVSTNWALKHPNEPFEIYSQQELISRCPKTGGSCRGGYFSAFDYISGKTGTGLPLESDLAYSGRGSRCNRNVTKKARAVRWFMVGNRDRAQGATIEQMKQALLTYGSLSVDVSAFQHTGEGVYARCRGGFGTNHMVNIEGWHDFANRAERKKYGAEGYWLMRNSWGNSFGKNGYAKVPFTDKRGRKCNSLGLHTAAAVVD